MAEKRSSKKTGKGSAVRFTLLFLLTLAGFGILLQADPVQRSVVTPHLRQIAGLSGAAIRWLGTPCETQGTSILSDRFSIDVVQGCDSLTPTAMFWAAVIAFPAAWPRKFLGMLGGAVALFALNILRIVTTFFAGRLAPSLFEGVHLYAWQALFILVALSLWLFWASRTRNGKS